jgi:hypothetical protein
MKLLIWYNPDMDKYEKGSESEYETILSKSSNKDRFDILYEFTETSQKLIDKILNSLNIARVVKSEA